MRKLPTPNVPRQSSPQSPLPCPENRPPARRSATCECRVRRRSATLPPSTTFSLGRRDVLGAAGRGGRALPARGRISGVGGHGGWGIASGPWRVVGRASVLSVAPGVIRPGLHFLATEADMIKFEFRSTFQVFAGQHRRALALKALRAKKRQWRRGAGGMGDNDAAWAGWAGVRLFPSARVKAIWRRYFSPCGPGRVSSN